MSFGGCTLGRGLTLAHFHSCGTIPSLNAAVEDRAHGQIWRRSHVESSIGISSGPTALFALIRDRELATVETLVM